MTELATDRLADIRLRALSKAPVSLGPRRTATAHEFYRYPARFSPELAASIIAAFTDEGDLVADYFVGGGTTLVEARLAGRRSFGSDINSLATFVTRVKTRLYTAGDVEQVLAWAEATAASNGPVLWSGELISNAQFRNFTADEHADHRAVLLAGVERLQEVDGRNARNLARCVLLRTAQWALDMRSEIPDEQRFREAILSMAGAMTTTALDVTRSYRRADRRSPRQAGIRSMVVQKGLPGVSNLRGVTDLGTPKLVLTSPPYPGVYVNYHRWKLQGRRETPLPYFIAGEQDGHGLAHYTMGARADSTLRTYFTMLENAFGDVVRMCSPETWIVQVVGFNDVNEQLPRYLEVMEKVGLTETHLADLATDEDGRLWREVPGRRWWTRAGSRAGVAPHTAREVILVHRLSNRR